MNTFLAAVVLASACVTGVSAVVAQPPPAVTPTPEERREFATIVPDTALAPGRMDWWREARLGRFIHWGLYAIPAGEWGGKDTYGEWLRHSAQIPREEYAKLKDRFNPTKFDARAWVKLAKSAGMKYITITTKHHDGFCLFDSKETEWDVMSTPFKRDIIKEMAEACREEGVRLCFYYSIMDWSHPDYLPRRDWETWSTDGADFERYIAYMKAQLKELLTNYGPIGVLWFDGQWEGGWTDERGRDLYEYVRGLQPQIIINSRVGRAGGDWGLDGQSAMLGDYATPEQTIPEEVPAGIDWETCMTMNGHWGYNRADKDFKSTDDLVRKLAEIASKGGNFLLNVGPTGEGEIPAESVERLQQIGEWMTMNGASIHGTRAGSLGAQPWGRTTERTLPELKTRMYLHLFEEPQGGQLGDGGVVVRGLLNDVRGAFLLADEGKSLQVKRRGEDLVVTVPDAVVKAGHRVVALDLEGAPDVMKAPKIETNGVIFTEMLGATITSTQPNVEIRYTTDGTDPIWESTAVGEGPVMVRETGVISARSFRDGRAVSPIARLGVTKVQMRRSSHLREDALEQGVRYEYFQFGAPGPNGGVDMKSVADLDAMKPLKTGRAATFDLSMREREKHWGVKYRGYVHVVQPGVYRFATGSDDGSRLWIGEQLVVENDQPHSFKQESGDIALAAGYHEIAVSFFENWGGCDLKVYWTPPGGARELIPAERLFSAK